ncbi:glutamate--cysteine ligase [Arthrobacter sp. AZCC_0090]|uniref:glutamate--cysteine ligase 2 n=1 Tax=Arthrobacter sp. AZCC_0090 TaxID=2735881 RepID=UPI00161F57FA|nr:glutamate--cysteine ligase [Arthrobacter sp. AZCC_0090]MBB6402878.1 carboxylate-amine ligase [Arthrobacter sp. AZCC_0090]
MRTIGVEEEFLIVAEGNGLPLPLAGNILDAVGPMGSGPVLTTEFKQEQIEVNTRPCRTVEGLLAEILAGRALADGAARGLGARIAATATPPVFSSTFTLGNRRYAVMAERFGVVAREQITCGFHVHVSIDSREEGIGVLDRIRPWLPVLLALSANSPFWKAENTGFASYRTQMWSKWPTAGPTEVFGSAARYDRAIAGLIETGVLLDEGMVYFDARLSKNNPTVEIRVADICLYAEDAAVLAAVIRALVETSAREWLLGTAPPAVDTGTLRLANWQASRYGVNESLIGPLDGRPCPAARAVDALSSHVRHALEQSGDLMLARAGLADILSRGTGERLQRQAFGRGNTADVVAAIVSATHGGGRPDGKTEAVPERESI